MVVPEGGVHFVGKGGMDLTPVDSEDDPASERSAGLAHFEGTGDDCELWGWVGVEGKGMPCLADESRPGFWKTGPDSDLPSFIIGWAGFQPGVGVCRTWGSAGWRIVGTG